MDLTTVGLRPGSGTAPSGLAGGVALAVLASVQTLPAAPPGKLFGPAGLAAGIDACA